MEQLGPPPPAFREHGLFIVGIGHGNRSFSSFEKQSFELRPDAHFPGKKCRLHWQRNPIAAHAAAVMRQTTWTILHAPVAPMIAGAIEA